MYKETKETYVLNSRDKMVMTYENGNIKILFNNDIKIMPKDVIMKVVSVSNSSMVDGKIKNEITAIEIKCEV